MICPVYRYMGHLVPFPGLIYLEIKIGRTIVVSIIEMVRRVYALFLKLIRFHVKGVGIECVVLVSGK